MVRPSRRQLMALLASAGLLGPLGGVRSALAAGAEDRRFLFVLAYGGWDPMFVMANSLDDPNFFHPDSSTYVTNAPLPYVDMDYRTATREFLTTYGDRGCILNGIEVPSISHEQCRKLMLTGASDGRVDDWAAILGGNAVGFDLPTVVVSGPAYGSLYASSQLRLGPDGQLSDLVSGDALLLSDVPAAGLGAQTQDDVQAYLQARRSRFTESAPAGSAAFVDGVGKAESQLGSLADLAEDIELTVQSDGFVFMRERAEPALELMERGLTRCASIVHLGEWDANWDTHAGIEKQGDHFEFLFTDLLSVFQSLEARGLLESTTVVVMSEMGRGPQLNSIGGKDHWTFTSAMVFGSGVEGGQVLGGYDDDWVGTPLDGRVLSTLDLGATLLQMGGLDPAEHLPRGVPITQLMSD